MKKWKVILSLAVILCLIFIILTSPGLLSIFFGPTKEEVGSKVKDLYELATPGTTAEVVAITEESGVYKVVLRLSGVTGTSYREVYVTKDGRLLTEGIILVEESIAQIGRMKNFVDCLDEKGVKIYGISNQTATLLQLNLLGRYSTKLFVACDGELIQRCTAANVTQVPSVVIGKYVDPGVKNIEWFERITGCKLMS